MSKPKPDAQLIIAGLFVAGGAISVICGKNLIAALLTLFAVIVVVTRPEILRLQKETMQPPTPQPPTPQRLAQQPALQPRYSAMRIVSTEGQQYDTSAAPAHVYSMLTSTSDTESTWTLPGVSTPADNEAVKARIRAEGLYGVLGRPDAAAMSRHAHQTFGFVEPLQARKDFLAYSLADMPHVRDEFMRPC